MNVYIKSNVLVQEAVEVKIFIVVVICFHLHVIQNDSHTAV